MKMYNRTQLPDDLLRKVIAQAGKRTKARTKDVVVKVTRSKHSSGNACDAFMVRGSCLPDKKELVKTDGGYLLLRVPKLMKNSDALTEAEKFFGLCVHEWAHIEDFQQKRFFGEYNRNWKNRPHERRAEYRRKEVLDKGLTGKSADVVLELAMFLEGERNG